jgi:hypothetical protein
MDTMKHRHLNHEDLTLAAIDDIISRGRLADWDELRLALPPRPELRSKILQVCAPHLGDPYAQRYYFWKYYVQAHPVAA